MFTCIFPGNIAQYTHRRDAFDLDTDRKRIGAAHRFTKGSVVFVLKEYEDDFP